MALNPDIRDQAYQFFIEEAPELLQSLETELLTLSQDHSTTRIHTLMRTAHSIKGGAASVGLEAIATLSHRLENIFRALYSDVLQIDTDLESQLLQAYDCLRLPLAQQIETGQFDIEQAMTMADPVFNQIESRLGHALTETENYIPSSSDLGVDMVSSILEVDVAQGLERLAAVVENPAGHEVAGELRAQAEVFAGFAELLNLPNFGAIAEVTQHALDLHPEQAVTIAQLALEDFERVRRQALNGKTTDLVTGVQSPSAALAALATVGEADRPSVAAIEIPEESSTRPEVSADLMDALALDAETQTDTDTEADLDISLSQLANVFGSDLDLSIFEAAEPELDDSAPDESVANEPTIDETLLDELEPGEWEAPERWPNEPEATQNREESTPANSDAIESKTLGEDLERLSLELFDSNLSDLDLPDSGLSASEMPTSENSPLDETLDDDGDEMPLDLELEQSEIESAEEMSAAFDFAAFDLSELDLSAFDLEDPSTIEESPLENSSEEVTLVDHTNENPTNASGKGHLNHPETIEPESYEDNLGGSPTVVEPLPIEVVEAVEDAYVHPRIDGEDYIVSFSQEGGPSEVVETTVDEDAIAAELEAPNSGSIIHIRSDYVGSDNASSVSSYDLEAVEAVEEMVQSVEHIFEELPALENTAELDWQAPAMAPLPIMPDSPSDLVAVDSQGPGLAQAHPSNAQASTSRPSLSSLSAGKAPVVQGRTVRVEAERLEKMSNLVGELAINRDGTSLQNEQLQGALKELLGQFSQFQKQIQQLRMVSDQMLIAPERQHQSGQPQLNASEALDNPWSTEFDSLEMDSYGTLHLQLQEIFEDVIQLEERVSDVALFAKQSDQKLGQQRQMLVQLRDDLTWARMVPLSEILNRFPRMIRDLSINYQKPASLKLTGASILVEKAILEKLYDPLLHLLRNAFDHGIEPPDMRLRNGKPEEGEIEIRAYHRGNQTIIEIVDDGQGLNLDRISDRAVERGWLTTEQTISMPAEQIYELIFEPGFSTTQQVSELSGRGVGLDVVRAQLRDIRGKVSVSSTPGQGTVFTLQLPLTLTITKLITFLSGPIALAIAADSVEEILTPKADQIRQLGAQRFLQWQENILPVYSISELLSYHCPLPEKPPTHLLSNVPPSPADWGAPIFILRRERQFYAVEVDRIITEQELVVKPFGVAIAPPPYTYGCTVLGDGSLVPVIDGSALLNFRLDGTVPIAADRIKFESVAAPPAQETKAPLIKQAPTLLVVDDSATLRRTLVLSLERVGFRVFQARDGQEALDQLEQTPSVQLVICDIEMPNMNGFEFLSYRRQNPLIADIPVVMLTSRSSEKHRWLAIQLGAAAYFTKPFLEQDFIGTLKDLIP